MRDKVTQTEQNKQMSEGREGGRVYVYVCVCFLRERKRGGIETKYLVYVLTDYEKRERQMGAPTSVY